MIRAHNSITDEYISDYIRLTHDIYPSFLTRMSTTYFSIDIENSNINQDLQSIYSDVSNKNHGGKYNIIYNLPVHMSTNNPITENSIDKGISIVESSQITVNIDPRVNIIAKNGDLLSFNTSLSTYFGVYRVTNVEASSTLFRPYTKLSLQLIPNVTIESLKRFVISESGFITNYHHIFKKEDALMIIELQKKIDMYINYFNSIYDSKIDAHVNQDHQVFLNFENAFNKMINKHKDHTNMLRIHKSAMGYNLLDYHINNNIFTQVLDADNMKYYDDSHVILYTSSIKRLDKTRRRSINNRISIYRLLDKGNAKDMEIIGNPNMIKYELKQELFDVDSWNTIMTDTFINNIKDQMTHFINDECVVDNSNMFKNAIRLAQVFYMIDKYLLQKMKNHYSNSIVGARERTS